jgi:1-acyl-sn-glycerol-3-phosphate acyltransferase
MSILRYILAIPLTIFFYLAFVLILIVFHLLQLITYYLLGYAMHKRTVDWLNFFMMNTPRILGCSIQISGLENLPEERSIIIVSNHQSMMDIPPIIWLLRKHHVKFIAKKELSNWVPSISFNLKKGGSLLIDRKKGTETVRQIADYAKTLKSKGYSICIFPEGTRSRDGQLKEFKSGGLKALADNAGDIPIVPFAVTGNYRIFHKGMFPLQLGQKLTYQVLEPVYKKENEDATVAQTVRKRIDAAIARVI